MTVTAVPPQTLVQHTRAFLRLVVIEHSIFALPFAYLAALTAMRVDGDEGVRWGDLALITVAMVGGRTFAMAANRIIDRHIDARNPRTANRELATGTMSVRTAWWGAAIALLVFLVAAIALNPLCGLLAPIGAAPLIIYPYAKRFTDLPQVVLGIAQAAAPIAAWLGVTGSLTDPSAGPALVLGVAVGLWIGGFDLIYACQDAEIDRVIGVRSVPARWGVRNALIASSVTHGLAFAMLVWFGALVGLGWVWWIGLAMIAVALVYEHRIVTANDLSRVTRAFFTANGFVSIALLCSAIADLFIRR